MITFVDTNVLLDVFLPDAKWGETSKKILNQAYIVHSAPKIRGFPQFSYTISKAVNI
jgi:predicted nucleic acid-binding protein